MLIIPDQEKKTTAGKYLKYLRMIFYLLNRRQFSQREKQQLDVLRRKFAIFLARKLKGWNLSHYLHKFLSHSIQVLISFN